GLDAHIVEVAVSPLGEIDRPRTRGGKPVDLLHRVIRSEDYLFDEVKHEVPEEVGAAILRGIVSACDEDSAGDGGAAAVVVVIVNGAYVPLDVGWALIGGPSVVAARHPDVDLFPGDLTHISY